MKDESVSAMLESGEIQMTEDVIFMVDTIMAMFDRAEQSPAPDQFIGYGLQMLEVWRTSLATNDEKVELSDGVIARIMGISEGGQ